MRAHEAGALHGDIGNRGPAWLRPPQDVNALVPQLWPRTVRRADGSTRFLSVKSNVTEGDTLVTAQGTYARMKFADGGEVVVA